MSVQELAQLFYKELDKEGWGTIDPYLFIYIADEQSYKQVEDQGFEDSVEEIKSLKRILGVVLSKLQEKS